jgi:hypothetical protein
VTTLAAFRFDKNGTNQAGMSHSGYTPVTWSRAVFGTLSSTRWWVAPCAGVLVTSAFVWLTAHVRHDSYANVCLKLIKNTGDVVAWPGTPVYGPNGFGIQGGSVVDICAEGDQYEVYSYAVSDTGTNDIVADGHPAHTHWSGVLLPLPC